MSATSVIGSSASLVGRKAPEFIAPAVMGDGKIIEDASLSTLLNGSYGVIVFYPLDFTFVCPTELVALDRQLSQFSELNAKVITVSVDSQYTHAAWRRQSVSDGGIGEVSYPMVSDLSHSICESYGVKACNASVALRATFILDRDGVVQSQIVNNLPIGRNVSEFIRVLQSLQHFEKHGEVCPVNWQVGDSGMDATQSGVKKYLESLA
jgi:peroxiredoxin (alkyl hydroperoxide reductase subunit C)